MLSPSPFDFLSPLQSNFDCFLIEITRYWMINDRFSQKKMNKTKKNNLDN